MSLRHRKPEDSAEGCRAKATADLDRAREIANPHMCAILQQSADAWTERAKLLDRMDASFTARAAANLEINPGRAQQGGHNA